MVSAVSIRNVVRRWPVAVAVLGSLAFSADGAAIGGRSYSAFGPARVTLKKSGMPPVAFDGNFRVHFDGESGDTSGPGSIGAYNSVGNTLLATVDCQWATKKGSPFTLVADPADLAAFLEGRIEAAVAGDASVTLNVVRCKGKVSRDLSTMKLAVTATGTATVGEGPSRALKFTAKLK